MVCGPISSLLQSGSLISATQTHKEPRPMRRGFVLLDVCNSGLS